MRAGLTNNPNLYLTAISARAAEVVEPHPEGDKAMDKLLQQLCEMLGLDDDCSPEEVLAAVRALNESARAR